MYLKEGNPKCREFVRKKEEYGKELGLLEPWVESTVQVSQDIDIVLSFEGKIFIY